MSMLAITYQGVDHRLQAHFGYSYHCKFACLTRGKYALHSVSQYTFSTESKAMNGTVAISILRHRHSVQRTKWESVTRLFIDDTENEVMQQRGTGEPLPYQLTWEDINAVDWIVVDAIPIHPQSAL